MVDAGTKKAREGRWRRFGQAVRTKEHTKGGSGVHLTNVGGPFMNPSLRLSQNSSGFLCSLLIAFMRTRVSCTLVNRSTSHPRHNVSMTTRLDRGSALSRGAKDTDANRSDLEADTDGVEFRSDAFHTDPTGRRFSRGWEGWGDSLPTALSHRSWSHLSS